MPLINVSVGELVDKFTILSIKRDHSVGQQKEEIQKEYDYLKKEFDKFEILDELFENLWRTNMEGWKIENEKRICERNKDFGKNFVELARQAYLNNDKRFRLKQLIDQMENSDFKEQKILPKYED